MTGPFPCELEVISWLLSSTRSDQSVPLQSANCERVAVHQVPNSHRCIVSMSARINSHVSRPINRYYPLLDTGIQRFFRSYGSLCHPSANRTLADTVSTWKRQASGTAPTPKQSSNAGFKR